MFLFYSPTFVVKTEVDSVSIDLRETTVMKVHRCRAFIVFGKAVF